MLDLPFYHRCSILGLSFSINKKIEESGKIRCLCMRFGALRLEMGLDSALLQVGAA